MSSVTKNSLPTLNTASASSPVSTLSAVPGATSAALHRSIRFGMMRVPPAVLGRREASLTCGPSGGEGWSMQACLSDLAGRTKDLIDEVATADLMVMISSAGTSAEAAAVIAEACAVRKVMTTALIIGSAEKSDDELSKTLAS